MVNYVKDIYAPFTDDEIAAKMVELLKPESVRAKVQIVYQLSRGCTRPAPTIRATGTSAATIPRPAA